MTGCPHGETGGNPLPSDGPPATVDEGDTNMMTSVSNIVVTSRLSCHYVKDVVLPLNSVLIFSVQKFPGTIILLLYCIFPECSCGIMLRMIEFGMVYYTLALANMIEYM